jgi:repressor LexA
LEQLAILILSILDGKLFFSSTRVFSRAAIASKTYVCFTRGMAHTPPGRARERVFRFVQQRLLEGRPPSIREVQAAMGFRAVESARSHLRALVEQGRLAWEQGLARGLRLPGPATPEPTVSVPLLGQVQAGDLTTAVQSPEGFLPVHPRRGRPEDLFALRVRGRSMVGAGILPGDLVVVRRQPTADDGEIVVALVGDEATVKRLRRRRGHVELEPANPRFRPIIVEPEEVTILGKVVEVRRLLD